MRSIEIPVAAGRQRPRVFIAAFQDNKTSAALADAWCELGVDAELVSPVGLRDRLRSEDIILGRLDVLPTLDGVEPGLLELLRLERGGFRVLNTASALLAAHDKLRTARLLNRTGLPHPRTTHLTARGPLPLVDYPLVVKPRFGSWGKDVFRCLTAAAFRRCLDQISDRSWFKRHGALVQELIQPRGHDLRVLVAGGRAVGAIDRIAAPGEWRTNFSLGGSRRSSIPSPAASALAEAAAAAIGADLVGVDLLPADGGHVIIELNGAVDFDRMYSFPEHDIYTDISTTLRL